jgi:hypothetical protein
MTPSLHFQDSTDDHDPFEVLRRPRRRGFIVGLIAAPAALLALGVGAMAMMTSDIEFQSGGVSEWLFVRGTMMDRLGVVAPNGPVSYMSRPQDGTATENKSARYVSRNSAPEVIDAYDRACRTQGFSAVKRTDPNATNKQTDYTLACDGEAGEITVMVAPERHGSRVTVLIYDPLR